MGETPKPPAQPAASSAGSFPEELTALRDAQRALKRGDGAEALAQLDALAGRHPDGVLQEERLAARVLGLCAAGRTAEARDAGRRFVAEHPGSVQIDRVRASCAFSPRDEER
jgi:outer membrane protein assembly factor BamD (BamD/ComL family)